MVDITIGIPKAFLYHQYGVLWETFFTALGCKVLTGGDTNLALFKQGAQDAVSECCLPAKVYMGHVQALIGYCDYILVPYAQKKTGGDAMCVRFWGIGDVVRHTYPMAKLLEYDICGNGSDLRGFKAMAKQLGKSAGQARLAYKAAIEAQNCHDATFLNAQKNRPVDGRPKILVAGHPYVLHDPFIGGPVVSILSRLGAVPFYSDRFDSHVHCGLYRHISPRLYWRANQEIISVIAAHKHEMDGVLLLATFPCAPDALAGEMTLRAIKDIPIAPILLDGLQGEAGLVTRLECFIDIINERKNRREGTRNIIPPYGQLSRDYRAGADHAVS